VHLGPPPAPALKGSAFDEPAAALAAAWRPGRVLTLFAELWLARRPGTSLGQRATAGLRLSWKGVALDLGAAGASGADVTPWIAATWTTEVRP
jgi:hypothetical protein